MNYAINSQQIIAGETPTHAQLGVSLSTVSAATASRYGLPVDTGAYVAAVTPDSGAAAAGIVPGDIVTAFDGQAVESASDLMLDVRTKNPGDTVTLTVNSGGQEKEVQVTLGDDSASQNKAGAAEPGQSMNGYSLEDLFGRQR
ncbi:MAG: S1C family serine protease [Adlercreutzia equolifaciens]